jgi:hypothetical protein
VLKKMRAVLPGGSWEEEMVELVREYMVVIALKRVIVECPESRAQEKLERERERRRETMNKVERGRGEPLLMMMKVESEKCLYFYTRVADMLLLWCLAPA